MTGTTRGAGSKYRACDIAHTSDNGDCQPEIRSINEAEHPSRILCQVHDFLMKVKRAVAEKKLDMRMLKGHEERLKSIDTDLQGTKRDTLLIDD